MPLSWNEIKSRATVFSRSWADAGNEDSQAKPFLIDFFEVFGVIDKQARRQLQAFGGKARALQSEASQPVLNPAVG